MSVTVDAKSVLVALDHGGKYLHFGNKDEHRPPGTETHLQLDKLLDMSLTFAPLTQLLKAVLLHLHKQQQQIETSEASLKEVFKLKEALQQKADCGDVAEVVRMVQAQAEEHERLSKRVDALGARLDGEFTSRLTYTAQVADTATARLSREAERLGVVEREQRGATSLAAEVQEKVTVLETMLREGADGVVVLQGEMRALRADVSALQNRPTGVGGGLIAAGLGLGAAPPEAQGTFAQDVKTALRAQGERLDLLEREARRLREALLSHAAGLRAISGPLGLAPAEPGSAHGGHGGAAAPTPSPPAAPAAPPPAPVGSHGAGAAAAAAGRRSSLAPQAITAGAAAGAGPDGGRRPSAAEARRPSVQVQAFAAGSAGPGGPMDAAGPVGELAAESEALLRAALGARDDIRRLQDSLAILEGNQKSAERETGELRQAVRLVQRDVQASASGAATLTAVEARLQRETLDEVRGEVGALREALAGLAGQRRDRLASLADELELKADKTYCGAVFKKLFAQLDAVAAELLKLRLSKRAEGGTVDAATLSRLLAGMAAGAGADAPGAPAGQKRCLSCDRVFNWQGTVPAVDAADWVNHEAARAMGLDLGPPQRSASPPGARAASRPGTAPPSRPATAAGSTTPRLAPTPLPPASAAPRGSPPGAGGGLGSWQPNTSVVASQRPVSAHMARLLEAQASAQAAALAASQAAEGGRGRPASAAPRASPPA